jgi:hypothetical protein
VVLLTTTIFWAGVAGFIDGTDAVVAGALTEGFQTRTAAHKAIFTGTIIETGITALGISQLAITIAAGVGDTGGDATFLPALLSLDAAAVLGASTAAFSELRITGFVATPRYVDAGGCQVQAHAVIMLLTATIIGTGVAGLIRSANPIVAIADAVGERIIAFADETITTGTVLAAGGTTFKIPKLATVISAGVGDTDSDTAFRPAFLSFDAATILGTSLAAFSEFRVAGFVATPWDIHAGGRDILPHAFMVLSAAAILGAAIAAF